MRLEGNTHAVALTRRAFRPRDRPSRFDTPSDAPDTETGPMDRPSEVDGPADPGPESAPEYTQRPPDPASRPAKVNKKSPVFPVMLGSTRQEVSLEGKV